MPDTNTFSRSSVSIAQAFSSAESIRIVAVCTPTLRMTGPHIIHSHAAHRHDFATVTRIAVRVVNKHCQE